MTAEAIPDTSGLHTALLCDVLDGMGYLETYCGPNVRPLEKGMTLSGKAFTLRTEPVDRQPDRPYETLLQAFENMSEGDVIVIASNGELRSGLWGELLSIAARARGAVGAVTDGLVRDVEQIAQLQFPVFAFGASPLDSNGRQEVVEFGKPIQIGETTVRPGDTVLGDAMGVIAIPAEATGQAIRLAREKSSGETTVRAELAAGADINEVFARHGIL
jgi:4-hydroxy-4-methyl-2-oxoglutarate aldolase